MTTSSKTAAAPWRRDRVLAAIVVFGALATLVLGLDLLPTPWLGITGWIVLMSLELVQAAFCWRVSGLPATTRHGRRFWRTLAVAPVLFAAASASQLGIALRDPGSPSVITGGPLQAALVSAGALVLVVAVLTSSLGLTTRRERRRFWLDAATVMTGVCLFAGQLADLAAPVHRLSGTDLINAVIAPAGFVVIAFGVVKITLGGAAPFTRAAGAFGCLAAVLQGFNTGLADLLLENDHASWKLGIGLLTDLSFVIAARVQHLHTRHAVGPPIRNSRNSHSRLPYMALFASCGLLIWVLIDRGLGVNAWAVLLGTVLSSGLVVVRQLAVFADNDDLLVRLDSKVRELGDAREVLESALVERDVLAERLHHLAYHDSLTGLVNRARFLELADQAALDGTATPAAQQLTVIILDLDGFKPVNDHHGHQAGDVLLKVVADRLQRCIGTAGTVARLGGDEFAVLMPAGRPEDVAPLMSRIAAAISQPVVVGTATVCVGVSIGAVTGPGDDVAALTHRADLEMYADKRLKAGASI